MAATWTIAPTVNSSTSSMRVVIWNDIGYRRRRGYIPPSPSTERWLRVAEDRADYRASTPPRDPHRTCSNDPQHVAYGHGPELSSAVRIAGRPFRSVV